MRLKEVRKAYDQNYNEILRIIQEMGGDDKIKHHRKRRTQLYNKLKALQRREHQLDTLENRLAHHEAAYN